MFIMFLIITVDMPMIICALPRSAKFRVQTQTGQQHQDALLDQMYCAIGMLDSGELYAKRSSDLPGCYVWTDEGGRLFMAHYNGAAGLGDGLYATVSYLAREFDTVDTYHPPVSDDHIYDHLHLFVSIIRQISLK